MGQLLAPVKSKRGGGLGRLAGQGALERQLHVPGEETAAVELAREEVPYSGLQGGVHGIAHSIGSAIIVEGHCLL